MICLLNKIKKIICIDIMVWVCVISLFLQTVVVYALNSSDDSISKETIVENNTSSQSDDSIDISDIYENNVIKIYNTKQLQAIGSNSIVTSTDNDESNYGTGQQISVNDEYITYSLSSKYQLMKDISLNGNDIWTLPSDFTGTFNHGTVDENSTLYDSSTDTIYIYNNYQLKIIQSDNSENEPVMSQDMLPECVGMGQPVYSDNSSNYLTYSKSHNYVLSKNFTGEMPETKANQISNISTENCEGRDFNGQVVKTIGDKTYILIGNEEQLRKIGSDETVYGAVYQVYLHAAKWYVDEDENGNPIMLYGGDADLEKSQNGNEDFGFGEKNIHKEDKKLSKYSSHLYAWGRCGVNQSTGEIDPTLDKDKATNQKYSSNANYIIFRNIDLSSDNWTPLMFQGTMIGSKGDGKSTLWNNDTSVTDYSKATDLNIGDKPVISNVNVSQTSELDVGEQMGVGFFATLSNEASDSDLGLSKGTVTVKNLKFNKINVDNETTKTKFDQTLISGLTSTLGLTLGALLDGLTWLLTFGTVNAGLSKTLSSILNARKDDPTALATGCFAGRVVGDVAISDCELDDVKVTNVNSNTGGFIGYISGKTEYDGLSKGLGGTATLLAKILNVIPGLGLGDLITILLGNAIPVDKLIPTKYINAYVENCSINNLTGNIGTNNDKIENSGGFIGQQKGTVVKDCQITNSNFNVKANNYSGGFVGLARDDVIEGTLSGALDIETQLPKMNPESLFLNCSVSASDLTISGNGYQGGFAGAMANTSAINCNVNVSDKLTVSSGGDNSGGFAGIATIGWAADLGKGDTKDNLLGGVVDLVVKLLSSNQNATSSLLSLAGVSPSHILGCQINAPCSVEGKNYTGGLIGRGDGVYLTKSNTDNLSKVSYFKNNIFSMDGIEEKNIIINGLKSVDGENCVGGISGSVGTASVAGLLNTTLGVAEYLGFNANSISLTGSTEGITIGGKGKRVGGAFGEAIGGSISSVTVTNLNNISGENIVGGFIGVSGPGDLAGTDNGLTVNLLGLNYILKLSNLLSLGQAVEVNIDSSSVSGINSGFTVEATGSREDNSTTDYVAAGFVAKSNSTKINDAKVNNLKTVTSTDDGGYSGGFIGISKTGGLAEVGDETEIKKLISANGLLNAVGYLIPLYQQCYVSYVDNGGVRGDIAGGFVADFQSGTVENDENNAYAIQNISYVKGKTYAGGFGGKVYSGALADSTKGISILGGLADLNIQISDLLSLIHVYIPIIKNAGVQSNGLVVSCDTYKSTDLNSGSAGGYIGYGSAVRVSNSSVNKLKHTTVKTPVKNINDTDSSSYFGESSSYAISAPKNAGGYVGKLDIGSTASVGGGLKALGTNLNLANILSALDVTASKIENSDVIGAVGGFSVKANGLDENKTIGNAGGFVGTDYGSQIQNSNVNNFSYIIGQETAGGYAGNIQPGSVADVLGKTEILKGLISVDSLTSVLQSFIPMIYNSQTTCIPCGGAVRADAISNETLKGCAGGYVGDLENVGLIDINLGSLLKLQVLAKGNALSVTLLGLTISVALDKDRGDGTSDLAKITIGDSYIEIPCSNIDGNHIADSEKENIKVGLIKSNRTKVDGCSITGIHDGYDVFGGKANDSHDGSEENGQAGGFIGYNNEGLIENNEMYLADTIRGTSNQIGPFSGTTSLNSSYDFNTKKNIEGKDNTYRIYRTRSDSLIDIIKNSSLYSKKDSDFDNWNVFKISHYDKVQKYDDLKDAKLANETESETVDLNAYVSPAKAVLMDDTEVSDNEDGTTPVPSDTQDPCNEKINITINKLWKDLSDKQKERPDTITVTLTRTYMKGSDEISEKVGDYTLSTNDVTDSKNTWQTVIKGLDAYTTLDDGSKAYYTYSVTESEVENYITSIEESDDGYTFTITNKDMPLLPDLGGKGTMLFVLVGIVGVLAVLLSYKKSKKARNIKE